MKKYLIVIGIVVLVGGALYLYFVRQEPSTQQSTHDAVLPLNPALHFEEQLVMNGIREASKNSLSFQHRIRGSVVPHHLLASSLIAKQFELLKKQNVETLIIIGPNHYELGDHMVLTSHNAWDTPFGIVAPDTEILSQLVHGKQAFVDDEVLTNDHAVAGLMPLVKYYLPDATVVPVLISGKITRDEIMNLSGVLAAHMNDEAVLVGAIDFSHYLTSEQAQKKDLVTWEYVSQGKIDKILPLSNDYLDSPPSLVVLMDVMKNIKADEIHLFENTNSGVLLDNPFVETTSYFSFVFY